MSAGPKTELVSIERERRVPDGMGGYASDWTPLGDLYAHVQWVGGGEAERQGAVRDTIRYRFTVWAAEADALAITTRDRIVRDGEIYAIRERPPRLPGLADCAIIAESGVTQ